MGFNDAYGQKNYMGEWVDDATLLTFIQAAEWDSNGDGTGGPQDGMWYYNSTSNKFRFYRDGRWADDTEQFDAMQNPTGFQNRTESTIAFDDGLLTFTVAPVAGSFSYWINGVKFEKTTPQTQVIPDTEGLYFFYFDGENIGYATSVTTALFYDYALIAVIYWNATDNEHILLGDERHAMMPPSVHYLWHRTFGTAWIDGLALTDLLVDQSGDVDTHAQLGYSAGEIRDEDLGFTPAADAAPTQIPVFHKDGALGLWRRFTATNFPVRSYLGLGTNRLAWNEFTGGAWQQTEATNNDYILAHLFATNDPLQPVIAIQGQAEYATLILARTGAIEELDTLILGGLPFVEFVPLGTVIFQTSNGYANAVQARTVSTDLGADYVDWRAVQRASAGAAVDHGSLSGLPDDDHLQYMAMARAGDIAGLALKAIPVNADVMVIEDSADANAKKKIPISVFGRDYQRVQSLAQSTTTLATFQTKVTLVTGALNGTFRIGYSAKRNNNDKAGESRLYNLTDASLFGAVHQSRIGNVLQEYPVISGAYEIVLTGVSKTIVLQWRDVAGGQNQNIKDAWIEFWRIS